MWATRREAPAARRRRRTPAARRRRGEWFDGGHGRRLVGGRRGFPHTGGTRRQPDRTNSLAKLLPRFLALYDETTRDDVPVRRINMGFGGVVPEEFATLDLFTDEAAEAEERRLQEAVLAVKGKFGKNALLRGHEPQAEGHGARAQRADRRPPCLSRATVIGADGCPPAMPPVPRVRTRSPGGQRAGAAARRGRADGGRRADRAQQFMPFAALRGYYDLIRERERVVEPKRALSEEDELALSRAFARLERRRMARVGLSRRRGLRHPARHGDRHRRGRAHAHRRAHADPLRRHPRGAGGRRERGFRRRR